mgnify:CR=1 FL=1
MYLSEDLYLRLVDYIDEVCDDLDIDFQETMSKIDSLLYSDDDITKIYIRVQSQDDLVSCIFKNFYEWNC